MHFKWALGSKENHSDEREPGGIDFHPLNIDCRSMGV